MGLVTLVVLFELVWTSERLYSHLGQWPWHGSTTLFSLLQVIWKSDVGEMSPSLEHTLNVSIGSILF